jgi:hypothetical protein
MSSPKPIEQFVEGLDWFVGVPLTALGALGLAAQVLWPSRDGVFMFLSFAALLGGIPLVVTAISFRRRWRLRWFCQAFALAWMPLCWFLYL